MEYETEKNATDAIAEALKKLNEHFTKNIKPMDNIKTKPGLINNKLFQVIAIGIVFGAGAYLATLLIEYLASLFK